MVNEQLLNTTLAALKSDMSREAAALFVDLIADYLDLAKAVTKPVSTELGPEELSARLAQPFPRQGQSLDKVVEQFNRDILPDVVRLVHPGYMSVPVAPPLPVTVWMESLIGALNQSTRAFAMSPTATMVERQIIRWLTEQIGFGETAGGTFTSGGTEANFTALLAARAQMLPDAWQEGISSEPPVVLCGENAHYTVFRAVAQLGLGQRRAITIPLRNFCLDTEALASKLQELACSQTKVMAVVATVGAFGTGSFDDLAAIADLCETYSVWLHVDGAHGASALLSEKHRGSLCGIERANSVTWDAHKMMLMPLSASTLLVKEERSLEKAFGSLEVSQSSNEQWTRSFMASRRADALKVWIALHRYGTDGLGILYEHLCLLTQQFYEMVSKRTDFEAFHVPTCNILCFRYVGDRSLPQSALNDLNRQLYKHFNRSGRGLIAAFRIENHFTLRVTLMNPFTQLEHLHVLLDSLTEFAQSLNEGLSGV